MIKIVTITGGSSGFALLSALKKEKVEIKSILSTADDGGSTSRFRKELKVMPPGDIRQCAIALSRFPKEISNSFNYRFEKGFLKGHALGNILISGLEEKYGSFNQGIEAISKIFNLKGEIIPVSLAPTELSIELASGETIKGEDAINKSKNISDKGIKKIYLNRDNKPNKKAINAIKKADLIILGPGNFYCSLLPILLVNGVSKAINNSKAKLFFVTNLINKEGHTDKFTIDDFFNLLNNFLEKDRVDFVIANNNFLNNNFEKIPRKSIIKKDKLIKVSLLSDKKISYSKSDIISKFRSPVIHDGGKLAKTVLGKYINVNRTS
ncbi:MAG: YvcK family protein [Patescibacteria group bacterium]|jgi:uncharacterized cofD-like protein|nr:YvcK family protein [Patescibacteria group bacterium]